MTDRPDQPQPATAPLSGPDDLPSPGALPSSSSSSSGVQPWATASGTTAPDARSGNGSAAAPIQGADRPASPAGQAGDAGDPVDADDLDLLEPAWTPPRRVNRWTAVLAGGLVAALAFAGGVLVQKSHDAALLGSSVGTGGAARAFARANGFGGASGRSGAEGGLGGVLPGASGGSGSAGSGSTGSGSGSAGPGTSSGTPVVVGSVVSVGNGVLVVQNFAGAKVTVKVPAGTPVTVAGLTGLRAGATVSVTGTKAADGTVTASSVTSRSRS